MWFSHKMSPYSFYTTWCKKVKHEKKLKSKGSTWKMVKVFNWRGLCAKKSQRKIHLFAGRDVKRERRKGSSRRQQTAYGAAVNQVAHELLRSASCPREKMAAEGTSSTTGRSLLQSVLVSAVDSCHCPHPSHPSTALLPITSLSLSLSLSLRPGLMHSRCDCVNCT